MITIRALHTTLSRNTFKEVEVLKILISPIFINFIYLTYLNNYTEKYKQSHTLNRWMLHDNILN